MSKMWYALCTKQKNEKRIASLLHKKKVETFLPLNELCRKNKNSQHVPLFPGTVFISIDASQIQEMRKVDGVIDFLYLMDTPAPITNEEIEAMRKYVAENKNIIVSCHELLTENNSADSQTNDSIIQTTVNNHIVQLYLPSLGYTLSAEMAKLEEFFTEPEHEFNFLMNFNPQPKPFA